MWGEVIWWDDHLDVEMRRWGREADCQGPGSRGCLLAAPDARPESGRGGAGWVGAVRVSQGWICWVLEAREPSRRRCP